MTTILKISPPVSVCLCLTFCFIFLYGLVQMWRVISLKHLFNQEQWPYNVSGVQIWNIASDETMLERYSNTAVTFKNYNTLIEQSQKRMLYSNEVEIQMMKQQMNDWWYHSITQWNIPTLMQIIKLLHNWGYK